MKKSVRLCNSIFYQQYLEGNLVDVKEYAISIGNASSKKEAAEIAKSFLKQSSIMIETDQSYLFVVPDGE